MDYSDILDFCGFAIYASMALVAIYGVFCAVMLVRRVSQKRFSNETDAEQFLSDVRDQLTQKNYDAVTELCDSPAYWSKAVPQLIIVAISNRQRNPTKLRRYIAEKFERDVLADLEYRLSWINTIVKSAPMLGLLGTVLGMILAFQTIGQGSETGTDPKEMADKIGIALGTTAIGLTIAIPLVMVGASINVRIGKLQDAVQQNIGGFLDDLEVAVHDEGGR